MFVSHKNQTTQIFFFPETFRPILIISNKAENNNEAIESGMPIVIQEKWQYSWIMQINVFVEKKHCILIIFDTRIPEVL